MLVDFKDDILRFNSMGLLSELLADKTTGNNIIWATDSYENLGSEYQWDNEIRTDLITGDNAGIIKSRATKAKEVQTKRTRTRAEVSTPAWLANEMNDLIDKEWFGYPNAFRENGKPTDKVIFPEGKTWEDYVTSTRLEITCGEAPFLVNRYDVSTGESIAIENRLGILDRKLRVVSENTVSDLDWLIWALVGISQTYGYEMSGDNLLIARLNFLLTFEEYMNYHLKRMPSKEEYSCAIGFIVWNLWQMDGLKGIVPYKNKELHGEDIYCKLYDWESDKEIKYVDLMKENEELKQG